MSYHLMFGAAQRIILRNKLCSFAHWNGKDIHIIRAMASTLTRKNSARTARWWEKRDCVGCRKGHAWKNIRKKEIPRISHYGNFLLRKKNAKWIGRRRGALDSRAGILSARP